MTDDNVLYFRKATTNMSKDNLGSREAAMELVSRLVHYYHSKNQRWVKVWLEPETLASGEKRWNIRSNIVFRVPEYFKP